MSRTTARHYRALNPTARAYHKAAKKVGEVRMGGKVIGHVKDFGISYEFKTRGDVKIADRDYAEIEARQLAFYSAFLQEQKDSFMRGKWDEMVDEWRNRETMERIPKQKTKVAPFPSNLDMAQFNAPANLARWAAQTRKVMEGLR